MGDLKTLEDSKSKNSGATSKNQKSRTARLQLALPESSFERLEAIKEATEAASFAEVVRRSLRIYEGLISECHDGSEIIVRRPSGIEEKVPLNVAL